MIPYIRRDPLGREQISHLAREVITRTISLAGKVAPIIARRRPFRFPLGQSASVFLKRLDDRFGKEVFAERFMGELAALFGLATLEIEADHQSGQRMILGGLRLPFLRFILQRAALPLFA